MTEIDDPIYTYPLTCPRCKLSLSDGVALYNESERCKETMRIIFPYMEIGERMHLECYFEHVIETYVQMVKK